MRSLFRCSLLVQDKADEALRPARHCCLDFRPLELWSWSMADRGPTDEPFVLIPRWWIVQRWNCARAVLCTRPSTGHFGTCPVVRPGRELDGVFTSSHDRLHPTRLSDVGYHRAACGEAHPSLGLHSITNEQRLGSLPSIVQLSFDQGCRSLPSSAGTGPVPHMALT